jgi:RNA polymerase sigma-70 factor (ECF subfamily)
MTRTCPDGRLELSFEQQRERLIGVAHRVLGSRTDAEDAVQEAWLRLARQDAGTIENPAGWLTRVVGRICIDMLRARKARPESPYDEAPPDWVVTEDDGLAPEDDVLQAEMVGLALLVVLDHLSPPERLAFVLHDMFAIPFHEIGEIIDKSTDAAKMLASRARRKVRCAQPAAGVRRQQREVVDAFLAAARDGDFEGLIRALDPDVTLRTHTARGVRVKRGATEVARTIERGRGRVTARRVLVNGEPGVIAWGLRGKPLSVMACTVVDGRIAEIRSLTDAQRLSSMDLPPAPE